MATKEVTMANEPQERRAQPGMGWPIAILLGTAVLTSTVFGYNQTAAEKGDPALAPWLAALIPVALGTLALMLYSRRFGAFWRPWSRRKRLYWISLLLAGTLGFVAAMALQAGAEGSSLFGNDRLTPTLAVALSLLWVGGLGIAMPLYHRSADDHEMQAYYKSALAGFYAFIIPCPVWWVLARAGLAPPVETMPLFLTAMIANAVAYVWFKFR